MEMVGPMSKSPFHRRQKMIKLSFNQHHGRIQNFLEGAKMWLNMKLWRRVLSGRKFFLNHQVDCCGKAYYNVAKFFYKSMQDAYSLTLEKIAILWIRLAQHAWSLIFILSSILSTSVDKVWIKLTTLQNEFTGYLLMSMPPCWVSRDISTLLCWEDRSLTPLVTKPSSHQPWTSTYYGTYVYIVS